MDLENYYENGGCYFEGQFRESLKVGQGKIYDKNGNIMFDGMFKQCSISISTEEKNKNF